jgi:hypothetical protein
MNTLLAVEIGRKIGEFNTNIHCFCTYPCKTKQNARRYKRRLAHRACFLHGSGQDSDSQTTHWISLISLKKSVRPTCAAVHTTISLTRPHSKKSYRLHKRMDTATNVNSHSALICPPGKSAWDSESETTTLPMVVPWSNRLASVLMYPRVCRLCVHECMIL